MVRIGEEELQKGSYHWFFGAWDNLLSGSLSVVLYCCEDCRKLEFYLAGEEAVDGETDTIAQTACPYCGALHDLDDAKCPSCGRRLQD